MSDKNYKGKKGVDGDDYKPLKFYQDHSSGVQDGFDKFSEGDEHYFTYNIDGEVVLISEGYASEKGRDNGIASVDKNRLIEARYKRDVYQSDKHFFNLVAGNHQEIATSAWFTSAAGMEAAIARLMGSNTTPLAAASIVGGAVAAAATSSVAAEPVSAPAPQAAYAAPSTEPEEEEEEGCGCTWLWFLLPVLLAALVWYLFSQCCSKPAEVAQVAPAAAAVTQVVPEPAPAPVVAEANVVEKAVETVQNAVGDLGAFAASKLPDGIELTIPEFGVENKLLEFIKDDARPVDKTTWFEFDRINFATGSADLTLDSREQIANIAQIMNAYPDVKLKIGGYTDSTGSAALNQTLSEQRAETVKNALITQGVFQERLESEGYGSQFPVASNDTAEGRAKNRRIALRVTEK